MPGIRPAATPGGLNRTTLELPTASSPPPLGRWLAAGTPIGEPYPCACDREHHYRDIVRVDCRCYGLLPDPPPGCCALRFKVAPRAQSTLSGRA